MIREVPDEISTDIGWPSDEVLTRCGARILAEGSPRVVEIGNRRFCEGLMESIIRTLDDEMFEALGEGRPNKTNKSTEH
jgi:hypothetical protein